MLRLREHGPFHPRLPPEPKQGKTEATISQHNIRAIFSSLTKEERDEWNALSQNDSTSSTDFAQAE